MEVGSIARYHPTQSHSTLYFFTFSDVLSLEWECGGYLFSCEFNETCQRT
jgi:hypothetical protein